MVVWKSETCIYPKDLSIHLLEDEAFMQRHQSDTRTVYNEKKLKMETLNVITM